MTRRWQQLDTPVQEWRTSDASSAARSPVASPDVLNALAERGDVDTDLVTNPAVPAPLLSVLATRNSMRVRAGVARHENTAPDTLAVLADYPACQVHVFANPNTATAILDAAVSTMITSTLPTHVECVALAANPNISAGALTALFEFAHTTLADSRFTDTLHTAIAGNPAADDDLRWQYLHPNHYPQSVRTAAAASAPRHVICVLADTHVTANTQDSATDTSILTGLGTNTATPAAVLHDLREHAAGNNSIAAGLASNPNTAPDTLDWVARHGHPTAHYELVRNRNTPVDTLRWLELTGSTPMVAIKLRNRRINRLRYTAKRLPDDQAGAAKALVDTGFPGDANDMVTIVTGTGTTQLPSGYLP